MTSTLVPSRISTVRATVELIRWSLIRNAINAPLFAVVQVLLAFALLYGMSFFMPHLDRNSAEYLASGAVTVNFISMGCVIAPQFIAAAKTNGMFDYQRSLPVPRLAILAADVLVWAVLALPGIIAGGVAAKLKFDFDVNLNIGAIAVVFALQVVMAVLGFMLAYWVPASLLTIVTQSITFMVLLFAPINYPPERLPEWYAHVHQFLPFAPAANLVRAALFDIGQIQILDVIVVGFWGLLGCASALWALARRD